MGLALVPRPRSLVESGGDVAWAPRRAAVAPGLRSVVDVFLADVAATLSGPVEFAGADGADLVVGPASDLGPEAFRLLVGDVVEVAAGGPPGAAYALTTLRQLLSDDAGRDPAPGRGRLARVRIEDAPAWPWRGVHLDVARHFFSVADVCRFVDLIAAHRLNRLHLHLNDDQGWRVEVPGWPRLTEVGAWRTSTPVGHQRDGVDDLIHYGGFYSAADLAVIAERAARRHVTIVPEIDLPGHAQAVLAAYPQLGTGEPVEVWTRWGVSSHVLEASEAALAFAEGVTTYVGDLFPASPVHIGGDECPTTQWAASQSDAAVMAAHGFSDPRQLQGLFTTRVAAALAARGHEVAAWDEVLDGDVPPGTLIVAWRTGAQGAAAARRGFDVVMAPQEYLYFDWLNAESPGEPVAQKAAPQVTTWERVYGFRVLPDGLEPALAPRVRGAQAQLWTEYIATRDHLDYMAFPRLCAFSEVVWGTATSPEEFRPRLASHLGRLAAVGVRFRPLEGP
ncbi:MAG: beta-N-acetylhexosaminidase [Acidimicrobiales bacterium]